MANAETLSPDDKSKLRATYLQVSHNLAMLVEAFDKQRPCSDIYSLTSELYEQCPTMHSPREWNIADECVSRETRRRLAGDYGQQLLDAVEKGIEDTADDSEENSDTIDYASFLIFFLGISEYDDYDLRDDNIGKLLERIGEWGSLQSITSMIRQEDYTVFEAIGFYSLLTCEEVPDWARLRILLLDSTALDPEARSDIGTGLDCPDSFICRNLVEVCRDTITSPDKYEPRFVDVLRGFVLDNLSLSADYLEGALGRVLDDVRACRDAIPDFLLDDSKKLFTD